VPAFCEATGKARTLAVLGTSARLFVMQRPDALRADIRRDEEAIRSIRRRIQKKAAVLNAMEDGGETGARE
jgi:hypothetical protein